MKRTLNPQPRTWLENDAVLFWLSIEMPAWGVGRVHEGKFVGDKLGMRPLHANDLMDLRRDLAKLKIQSSF